MTDLRRRKPDEDGGKWDEDTSNALKPERCGDGLSGSDDERQSHHRKTLSTADSSDHVNTKYLTCF